MKQLLILILFAAFLICSLSTNAQTTERPRPAEWSNLVYGGRFMDRFLPMPNVGKLNRDTWGADNVLPRYIDNGIENRKYSFWGGNKVLGDDGKYHFYVCGWLESSPRGHATWPNSIVFHAVSDNLFGQFVVKDTIGKGHNPEVFKLSDGRYVLYVIGGCYVANGVNGPWTYGKLEYLNRDRRLIEGNSNYTFTQREDGSYLMICRGGGQWFSQTGFTPFGQVTGTQLGADKRITPLRAYPPIQGNFAVIDVEKNLDRGSDIHSSKNISIPLTVGRLLTILGKKPITAGNVFPNDEFAAKMLGKTSTGKLLFGYARLPGVNFIEPILSPLLPVITTKDNGFSLKIEVQNFGQVASKKAKLKAGFIKDDKEVDVAAGTIPALKPYEKTTVELTCGNLFDKGVEYIFKVTVNPDDKQPVILHGKITPVK